MTRLNKVKKLEERIAPSYFGFSGNAGVSGDAHVGNHVDSSASANVSVSASSGWVNPLLLMRALEQNGLEGSISLDSGVKY